MSLTPDPASVLDSVNDGVYVTDTERRIVYWNPAAERITGWTKADIVGRTCYDEVLCHEDKDGRRLCGKEHCPLHRSIVTGNSSTVPIIVFAGCKDGSRVPVRVSVAPIRSRDGEITGGVETFRDLTPEIQDFERAQKIQSRAMRLDIPADERIVFSSHHVALDIVGGDFLTACQLDNNRYGFMLADVSGHGIAAGLYTMCLYPLWQEYKHLLVKPARFAESVSRGLCDLMDAESAFAAAACGVIDLAANTIRVCGAGNPQPLLFQKNKTVSTIECPGLPLGMISDATYEHVSTQFNRGDTILFFSDGATEISMPNETQLGLNGLSDCLARLGYPLSNVSLKDVETALLELSNCVRFADDMTLLEMKRT